MDNVDRLATAKKLLCRSIMSATSPFDLAKSLWDIAGLECKSHRLSALSGMMPVLAVFESLSDGGLYYKKLDPNTATEWNLWNEDRKGSFSILDDWMGAGDVEVSITTRVRVCVELPRGIVERLERCAGGSHMVRVPLGHPVQRFFA